MSSPIFNQSPFRFLVHKKFCNYFFLSPFSPNKLLYVINSRSDTGPNTSPSSLSMS